MKRLLLIFSTKMAAILAWIVGTITGSRKREDSIGEGSQIPIVKNSEPVISQEQDKNKKEEEPTFDTTLSTPVEDFLEDTIKEECSLNKNLVTSLQKGDKLKKKEKVEKSEKSQCNSEAVNKDTSTKKKVKNKNKPILPKVSKNEDISNPKQLSNSENDEEEPFVTVKERSRKKGKAILQKQNSQEIINNVISKGITKKVTVSSSIIDHYTQKDIKSNNPSVNESFVLISNSPANTKTEAKSKTVSSHISYASVLTNSVSDIKDLEENSKDILVNESSTQQKENNEISSSIEVLSEYSEEFENDTELAKEVCEDTVLSVKENIVISEENTNQLLNGVDSLNCADVNSHKNQPLFDRTDYIQNAFDFVDTSISGNNEIKFDDTEKFLNAEIFTQENTELFGNKKEFLFKKSTLENSAIEIDLSIFNYLPTVFDYEKKNHEDQACSSIITEFNSSIDFEVVSKESKFNVIESQSNSTENCSSNIESFIQISEGTNSKLSSNTKEEIVENKVDENLEPQLIENNPNKIKEIESKQVAENSVVKQVVNQASKNLFLTNMTQVRVLILNDKEHQQSTIYRIEKTFILQFRLGPSLLGRKIKLYCNYPPENGVFNRDSYQLLNWCQDEGCKNADDTALFTYIEANLAGSFHYYFVYDNADDQERQGSGYFIVDPLLTYGNNEKLPLDCIQCQTVLAKQLGPFSSWERKLEVAKESGYNIIHFTPIQELGASNSSYSLSEQLVLNPLFTEENSPEVTFGDVEKFIDKLRKDWKVLSICDIVLNHTANESKWLKDHPESTYNCLHCPYLRPAYILDAAFHVFSLDVKKGNYENCGIPTVVDNEDHLNAIRYHFKTNVLEGLKIYQLYTVDVNKYVEDFMSLARKTPPASGENKSLEELKIIQDVEYRRLKSTIDLDLAVKTYNVYRQDCFDEESRLKRCTEDFKTKLESLNDIVIREVNDDLNVAVENVIAGIRYHRVQQDGPRFKDITENKPLVYRYFTDYGSPITLSEYEEIMYSENGKYLMAHNGWVMNSDPLKNFAAAGTKTYIRRELIAWGDSVKLHYGDKPEDCPFLWNHMRKYVEQTAKIFDGIRLDNCHSTPIHVAEYLLDCARKVRPDLYVVAELFTNSDLVDNIFVNRLGITSLIREAMSAWDSHEEGRLVYRYGGLPVGSFYQPNVRPLVPMVAHALFLDLTHDNPSPVQKRSVFDLLTSSALVNMACCASGSNRGYDELVPHHIHVVDENRQYTEWSKEDTLPTGNKYVNSKSGIIPAKKALHELHYRLGKEGYSQVYVDQIDPDIVAVTRHNPDTHSSYVLVAFTAFSHPDINAGNYQRGIKPLRIEGVLDEIVLEASLSHINGASGASKFTKFENFVEDPEWINGLSEYQVSVKQHISVSESDIFEEVDSGSKDIFQLNFKNFKPGSVVAVKVSLPEEMNKSISYLRSFIDSISSTKNTEIKQVIEKMTLADINRALYRCGQEERDEGNGFDVYNIPNFGPLVYCGLQGFMSLLANIRPSNDLGHPFCGNLRDGNWMIDYIWKRLQVDEGTKELGQWIEENIKYLYNIPRYLIPCYFDVIVTEIYTCLLDQSYNLMSDFVKHGSSFVKGLSLGSLQFGAYIKSADLPTLSPNLAPPKPPVRESSDGRDIQACVSLSAGLPHFSVGYMRNWGRDTFIALRGLFILTGRFEESRQHILAYAACLRHGLIPNLLDGGRNPRFNCRDAIWWWLYCIKSYCEEVPDGVQILSDKVSRIFPTDDSPNQPPGTVDQPLHDVIQEGLKVHFQGLKFRERNAGRQIDEHMTDAGFNNQIGIHPDTGFVFGGNQWNCGTWMDKMGSSDKAGNRGKPATPRDGSAVELVGLSKAAVSWLWELNQKGHYPYDGVERLHKNGSVTKWTFKFWADKIQENFEKNFWIDYVTPNEEPRPDLINRRTIYKDIYGSSLPWTDYQLRCNFPIAMVAAPELFNPQHAWAALEQVEKCLLGPLGIKTLDTKDWNYRGDYDNSNDSNDIHTAHGFNYHQGPEWVWPVGFFLRAKLIFAAQNGLLQETVASTKIILAKHLIELQTSLWRGLPELTNSNGSYCNDSSRTQAWSMSCILEVLHDLQKVESRLLKN
ncbi:glycogen debranching enzyme isoform X2 [Sitophilus oryzae]|uniref:Glycogen debranching enzyme n=1 Tax=Sitophilus oryzae TaxID=7048 RepID=A0A6J2XHZ7_SITOR|nr:glycogen debranching enzyme isoform X2 [Sitophilus oryzae]